MGAVAGCPNGELGRHQYRYAGTVEERDDCDRPRRLVCLDCADVIVTRCGASSRAKCGPCSQTYRRRVGRIFASGWTDRPTDRTVFLTLTAPSHVGRHRVGRNGPWCECTPEGGVHLGEWNGTAGQRWSHFVEDLRREFGRELQFCKAAEAQERGAMHFHALVRCEADLAGAKEWLRALAIKHGFGHEIDVRAMRAGDEWYCAKYASKSADDRATVPWVDVRTGEVSIGSPRLRVWTASRGWGLSMVALRRIQAAWAKGMAERETDPPSGAPATPAGPYRSPDIPLLGSPGPFGAAVLR